MTEGASGVVDQGAAPAVKPAGAPDLKSLWARIKPVWWMRGILGAIALVSFMDAVGFGRGWLRAFHAIGARWHEWMQAIGAFIREWAPFPIDYQAQELTVITFMSTIAAPALVPFFGDRGDWAMFPKSWAGPLNSLQRMAVASLLVMGVAVALAFAAPGDSMIGPQSFDPSAQLPDGWREAARVAAVVVLFLTMALWNWRYFAVLTVVFTFIATLEAFYFVPVVDGWIEKFVNWIDPLPTPVS